MTRIVFLDTETTSLDDTRGEVWEIGAIERRADGDHEWLWQIAPTSMETADPNSLRIARFYERFDRDTRIHGAYTVQAPSGHTAGESTPHSAARHLALMLDGAHVVGAVPDFDYRFLRRFLTRYNECWAAHYHLIDIEAMAVGWLHGKAAELQKAQPTVNYAWALNEVTELPWKSTALYRALKVNPDEFEAHTALGDARLVRAVYDAITGGAR
jgi:DNA polymerase III epsilon subunit-like protein